MMADGLSDGACDSSQILGTVAVATKLIFPEDFWRQMAHTTWKAHGGKWQTTLSQIGLDVMVCQ